MTQDNSARVEAPTLRTLVKNIDQMTDAELDAHIVLIRESRRKLAVVPPRKKKATDEQKSITRKKKRTKAEMMTPEELDAELNALKGMLE